MNEQKLKILQEQENILQFEKFDNDEAYKLGIFMTEYAKKHNIIISISIRLTNGLIIFQHMPQGTGLMNQKWIERKFNTVLNWQKSSLYCLYMLEHIGEDLKFHALSEKDFALCGGGFPIRVKNCSNIVGVILSSNLHHIADHEFIINSLKNYLNISHIQNLD